MRFLTILLIFLSNCKTLDGNYTVNSTLLPIKVAVIDTGLDKRYFDKAHLCSSGHKDFTGEGLDDIHGHGTNVTGLIVETAQSNNYCIIIIKAYSFKDHQMEYITKALEYAYNIKADIINLSGGGIFPVNTEKEIVQKILDAKITLITAAGNNHTNLNTECKFFPACYDKRIVVIGGPESYSNYGEIVDIIIPGRNKTAFGYTFYGTSQSTAIATGKLLKSIALK